MNLASLPSQNISTTLVGDIAQLGLGWAQPSEDGMGLGGVWDVFSVEDAQSCGNCRRLKTFNSHKKVKALTAVQAISCSILPWLGWSCRQVRSMELGCEMSTPPLLASTN